jgi:hypothetical protein
MVVKLGHFGKWNRNTEKFLNVELEKDGEDLWADRVRNETALHKVKEKKNIIHTIKRRKTNWIDHILCRKGLIKHII